MCYTVCGAPQSDYISHMTFTFDLEMDGSTPGLCSCIHPTVIPTDSIQSAVELEIGNRVVTN